jgi:hypothetical protein
MSNEPTIEQMNEAIAEFMDYSHGNRNREFNPDADHKDEEFKYHSSWDWLMPVVNKAKALYLNYESYQMRNELKMRYRPIENELRNLSLINTQYCLFKFIQWYNNKSNTTNDTTKGNAG